MKRYTTLYLSGIFLFLFTVLFSPAAFSQGKQLTVYASGPYQVWGGYNEPDCDTDPYCQSTFYYNINLQSHYTYLGSASAIHSVPGSYRIYVIVTNSLFSLDAVKLPDGRYLAKSGSNKSLLSWGNVHLPWEFDDDDGSLIGSPFDYIHDNYIYGAPDGLTDQVGIEPHHGSTGENYEGFVAVLNEISPLEVLDGSEFSEGREVTDNIEKLSSKEGTPVRGAVTDGVTRLLLRISLYGPADITITIKGDGRAGENGTLRSIDGSQSGESITVSTVATDEKNGGYKAFAVYRAPENFVRQNSAEDKAVSQRKILLTFKNASNSSEENEQELLLVRPPILLVHGLWSGPEMWNKNNFSFNLANQWPGIRIFKVNYAGHNDAHLATNREVIKNWINRARIQYKSDVIGPKNIAMVQADVIGHSMGGLLARIWAGTGFNQNIRDDNYQRGDINRLITIDTPHYGSFIADAVMLAYQHYGTGLLGMIVEIMEVLTGNSLLAGAVEDMMSSSKQIKHIRALPASTLSYSIVGNYPVSIEYLSVDNKTYPQIEYLPSEYLMLQNVLILLGYGDIIVPAIDEGSDLVVSVSSQKGGMGNSAVSIFSHHHMNITNTAVYERCKLLLNADSDGSLFSQGQ